MALAGDTKFLFGKSYFLGFTPKSNKLKLGKIMIVYTVWVIGFGIAKGKIQISRHKLFGENVIA